MVSAKSRENRSNDIARLASTGTMTTMDYDHHRQVCTSFVRLQVVAHIQLAEAGKFISKKHSGRRKAHIM